MRRTYLDDDDREYVIATKRHLSQLIERRGMAIDDLAYETGIPVTSLRRWLNPKNSTFMPLPAARRTCLALGIEISDMLLPVGHDRRLDRAMRIFLQLPPRAGRHRDRSAAGHRRGPGQTPPLRRGIVAPIAPRLISYMLNTHLHRVLVRRTARTGHN